MKSARLKKNEAETFYFWTLISFLFLLRQELFIVFVKMSIYEPIQNVYGNVETPLIQYYTLTFPKNSRERPKKKKKNGKKNKNKTMTGETIRAYPGVRNKAAVR